MWLRLAVASCLVLSGCIGTRDAFLYVSLANGDATDYVVLAMERGFEDVPVGYRLAATQSGYIVRSDAWQGRVTLVDEGTCRVLDSIAIGPAGATATVQEGSFRDVSDGPAAPADQPELEETQHCH